MNESISAVFDNLSRVIRSAPEKWSRIDTACTFAISGEGGGTWTVLCKQPPAVSTGEDPHADCALSLSGQDFLDVIDGKLNPQLAFLQGRVQISGDIGAAIRLNLLLDEMRKNRAV